MKRITIALLFLIAVVTLLNAFEPRFVTDPAISPDGSQVCFVYQQDLWLVPNHGGTAKRLTSTQGSEYGPVWSPDGSTIAFSANREGQTWVYTMPAEGGLAKPVFKDGMTVCEWFNDGINLLCSKGNPNWGTSLYKLPLNGQRPQMIAEIGDYFSVLSPDNSKIMFNRYGEPYREAYTGSKNGDLWEYNVTTKKFHRLTETVFTERYPRYSYISDNIYFCASDGKRFQLYKAENGDLSKKVKLTDFNPWSVRDISIARQNDRIVFELFDEIWCYDPLAETDKAIRKISINIAEDNWRELIKTDTVINRFDAFAISEDDLLIAFSYKYDLFVMPRKGGDVRQITYSQNGIEDIAFLNDSRTIVYTQYKEGLKNLYKVKIDSTYIIEPVNWIGSNVFNVDSFYRSGNKWAIEYTDSLSSGKVAIADSLFMGIKPVSIEKALSSRFVCSPDGSMAIYASSRDEINIRELFLYDFTTNTSQKVMNDDAWLNGMQWLPNQKSVLLRRSGNNKGIFRLDLIPRDEYELDIDNWNEILVKETEKDSVDSLSVKKKPASQKQVKSPKTKSALQYSQIDWYQIDKRIYSIIPETGYSYPFKAIDDTSFYFIKEASDAERKKILAQANIYGKNITDVGTLSKDWEMQLVQNKVLYYKDGDRIKALNLKSKSRTDLTNNFKYKYDVQKLNETVFEQVWGIFGRGFYDPAMHNVDWNNLYRLFRPYLQYADTPRILETIVEEMIGEVNASHTGFYSRTEEQGRFRDIAYLGLEFNLRKFLPVGLEISRIYPGSRLYSYYGIRNGDILLSINKTKLTLDVSIDSLLSEQVNRKIDLVFICNSKEITCSIKGMAWRENRRLWFQDKQERLRQMTDDLSGSQIGYVLIPQMNTEEYNNFIRNLYTMNADKKALIIDIRGNTGGSIHNDLLSFLSRRPNAYTSRRSNGAVKRETPSRTWTKPIVLLIDENSYSDAEIFPQLFQEANLGTVIGMPTSGAVIGTWEVKLLDGSRMRMPGSGWFRLDGTNMEGNGAQPDIQIELTPEDIISENDKQLQKAVEVLLLQIK